MNLLQVSLRLTIAFVAFALLQRLDAGTAAAESSSVCQISGIVGVASTPTQFKSCITKAENGTIDEIDINGQIQCNTATYGADGRCLFTITGINNTSLLITGANGSEGQFVRPNNNAAGTAYPANGGYYGTTAEQATLTIKDSTGPITIQNVEFDEGTNVSLPASTIYADQTNSNNSQTTDMIQASMDVWQNNITGACPETTSTNVPCNGSPPCASSGNNNYGSCCIPNFPNPSEWYNPCNLQSLAIIGSSNVYVLDDNF
jgi:hypothetical protein